MAVTGSLQIKNGKYYTVINYKDERGKRKQKWFSTGLDTTLKSNKKAAEKMLASLISEYEAMGDTVRYSHITVAGYFESWLEEIIDEVRPNTYRTYYSNMINHIIPYFRSNKLLLCELKPYHLECYYRSKITGNSRMDESGTLSTTTIKHHHQNISKALTDAARKGYITNNPAMMARTPKLKKYQAEFLSEDELRELILLVKDTTVEIPVTLCAVYGFRRSEVLGLKWDNVDLDERTITICETLQQNTGGEYTDLPKTMSSYRTLPMTDSIYELLKSHKAAQGECDYVCTDKHGEVIKPNYLSVTFHKIVQRSSLPGIRLHDIRHSVASCLLSKGFSVVQVQEWLGHGSASTTLNFYAHADKRSKSDIAKSLENLVIIE